jgi:2-succinyl-5-enolpyruvyl-6-hydroxy-3-cyclohexene-1-carboxylate synthase
MNQALGLDVLQKLIEAGVTEFCVCPGARNSPFIDLLLKLPTVTRLHFFEERSAAFFALGRIKSSDRPVAIVTTSGTAAGELLPATMEAYYSALPLVLLTADRPRRFRGTGAPQTAEQVGIFGIYTEKSIDLAAGENLSLSDWSGMKPLHLNVCFEEPLIDTSAQNAVDAFAAKLSSGALPAFNRDKGAEDIRSSELEKFLETTRRPLVLVGALHRQDRDEVRRFLLAYGAPTYFEAHSGLREDKTLSRLRVHGVDGILERARKNGYEIDGVLRIGGVPTLRLWRDLEILNGKIPVCSISREPFSGLSWAKVTIASPSRVLRGMTPQVSQGLQSSSDFLANDHAFQERLRSLFHQEPTSEPGLFHSLSRAIPAGARIFIGNSLPIREWDLAATYASREFEVSASRGLNGIDGQVSTFYGFSEAGKENWAIIGDLTALYDLPGPWALSQISEEIQTSLVVVNNRGGKIFSRMFGPKEFQNQHSLDFSAWARLWKLPYEQWQTIPDSGIDTRSHRIIELTPEDAATQRFWKAYASL